MSFWPFNVNMDALMKKVKMRMRRRGVKFLEEGRVCRLRGLLYADDLVLYGESEEELWSRVGTFFEVCWKRGLKLNAGDGEEGLECGVCVDGMRLENVLEFKYLECILEESVTDEV